jgi:peptidoglycan/LPS O-acetylase OafA/YrhL
VHFDGLEGLRAISIIAVFLSHLGFITGTTYGSTWFVHIGTLSTRPANLLGHLEFAVAIFLMISAFLLYRPFVVSAFAGTPMPGMRRFMQRRVFRLFPAYWITLVLLWVLGWIQFDGLGHVIRVVTLTQIYSEHTFFAIPILVPTWTLATEFTFYIFLVGWAPLMRRIGNGRSLQGRLTCELVGAGILGVFAVFFRGLVYHGAFGLPHVAEHWLPGTLDIFAVGLAFAAIDAYMRAQGRAPSIGPVVADGCAVIAVFWFLAVPAFTKVSVGIEFSTGWDAYARNVFQLLCAAFLLAPVTFVGRSGGLYRALCAWRPLAYTGLVSYGLYLWHDAWIVQAVHWSGGRVALSAPIFVVGVSAFALALASGTLSHHFVEQPALRYEARFHQYGLRGPRAARNTGSVS